MHWLPIQSRIEFKIACITYKALATGPPIYLSTLLNHYTPLRTLRSANQYLMQHPRVSTEFANRSFRYLHLKFGTTYPSISALLYPTNLQASSENVPIYIAFYSSLPPSSSPSDCLRLIFSMFADTARVTNVRIIIIIIVISLQRINVAILIYLFTIPLVS